MAISKEELKQMLDSTIIANGQKGITAESLNNALTAIIEAMGTGSGAGSEYVDMTMVDPENSEELTSEAMAHNVEVYNKLINALSTTGPVPTVVLNMRGMCMYVKCISVFDTDTNDDPTITLALDYPFGDGQNYAIEATTPEGVAAPLVVSDFNALMIVNLFIDGSIELLVPGLM